MKINLSDGEWKLMLHLWDKPHTITELCKAETGLSKHSIITMLSRMSVKGAVAFKQRDKAKSYYPLVERGEVVAAETKSFLHKVFGGNVGLMLNSLIESDTLTKDEIDELYSMLGGAGSADHD